MPTASAVVADLIDTVVGRTAITFRTLEPLVRPGRARRWPLRDPADVPGRFYLRFNVDDRPGVMAEIAGILGRHDISIASVIQHETEEEVQGVVPLVIMTHNAPGRRDAPRHEDDQRPFRRPSRQRADESAEISV